MQLDTDVPFPYDGDTTLYQTTLRDGNRASEVIQRLRTLFQRKPPSTEPVDLNDLAREVLTLSSGELLRSRVILRTDFAEGLPAVLADRVQLQQVILNLVLNDIDRLFDAFYTTKSHGMGVGLSISRSIIESHNGRLWATANDGPGASFLFLIPCTIDSADEPVVPGT